ncbi:DUF190 domain-containing protein [Streptomyces xinghaiensis]|uniref:DUF190 domain-containing protein n=1 Tax=Streptomyces xinghaiensis TaxID=1038928 RepID=UPI00031C0ABE|nr:DUF190 domain-containing protein [Streptomyces xinghaiensis]MZE81335.1 DUF190 domain-containing protein [Streptomyces sp. SID5475]
MSLPGPAVRVTVFVSEMDTRDGTPLCAEILRAARECGLAGATVSRGVEGFGRPSVLHSDRLLSFSDDLPLLITIIDAEERIQAFLEGAEHLLAGSLVVLDEVRAYRTGP